jgi:hypothetical protein
VSRAAPRHDNPGLLFLSSYLSASATPSSSRATVVSSFSRAWPTRSLPYACDKCLPRERRCNFASSLSSIENCIAGSMLHWRAFSASTVASRRQKCFCLLLLDSV